MPTTTPNEKKTEVLLVDDDPVMRHLLRRWMEQVGYVVRTANDGSQAIEAIGQQCPHVVVTDMEMPNVDGIQLCRWVRDQALPIHVICLTSHENADALIRGLEAGADDFMKKPVDRDEFVSRLFRGARACELQSQLSTAANHDFLTGFANRRAFRDQIEREWARATRYGSKLSCVMLDIDLFKRANDSHGHDAGDEVLRHVARLLRANLRISDIACRYGGDEFCVLLPETDEHGAVVLASRLRDALSAASLEYQGTEIGLSASFGVAERLAEITDPDELIRRADQALLVAKRAGRNRVARYRSNGANLVLDNASVANLGRQSPAGALAGLTAVDLMTPLRETLSADATVAQAADYLARHAIHAAPLVGDEGRLIGMATDHDIMASLLATERASGKVGDMANGPALSFDEHSTATEVFEQLARSAISRAIVLRDGRPIGIVDSTRMLRRLTGWLRSELASASAVEDTLSNGASN